jgi:hypothetical protein
MRVIKCAQKGWDNGRGCRQLQVCADSLNCVVLLLGRASAQETLAGRLSGTDS